MSAWPWRLGVGVVATRSGRGRPCAMFWRDDSPYVIHRALFADGRGFVVTGRLAGYRVPIVLPTLRLAFDLVETFERNGHLPPFDAAWKIRRASVSLQRFRFAHGLPNSPDGEPVEGFRP